MTRKNSRQRMWQLRKTAQGLCVSCGKRPVVEGYRCCEPCCVKYRARTGHNPWRPGKVGRPPSGVVDNKLPKHHEQTNH